MPHRIYRGHHPPRFRDHALSHPYEALIALGGLLACSLLLLAEIAVPVTISPTMASLPGLVAWLVGLTGVIGNTLVLAGIFDDGEDLMRGWMLERVGLVGAITSWGTYSLAVAAQFPGSAISYGLTLFIAMAHMGRLVATLQEEGDTRSAIRESGAQ